MEKIRQAVIMVGGLGTRLRPLTETRPKPAMPVLDKPFLKYLIESIQKVGVKEIILACGYKSDILASSIGNGEDLSVKIFYSDEDEPLGTGGAIKNLEKKLDDVFIAANGDTLNYLDLNKLIEMHFSSNAAVTISVSQVEDPSQFGVIKIDKSGRVLEFQDKPARGKEISNLINSGIYVVQKSVLQYIPENKFYDFSKELFPLLIEKGENLYGCLTDGMMIDIGRPSDLIAVNVQMSKKLYPNKDWKQLTDNTEFNGTAYIGKNAKISDSILNNAIVSEEVTVVNSKITNSLIMKGCVVKNATIEDSILGEGCVIEGKNPTLKEKVLGDGTKYTGN